MANVYAIKDRKKRLGEIQDYLFKECQEGIDATGLAKARGGNEQIARRDLAELEKENFVRVQKFGNTKVYYPLGKLNPRKDPHQIDLTSSDTLCLDTFSGVHDKFIRISQKRREDKNTTRTIGSIILPFNKIKELKSIMDKIIKNIKKN